MQDYEIKILSGENHVQVCKVKSLEPTAFAQVVGGRPLKVSQERTHGLPDVIR